VLIWYQLDGELYARSYSVVYAKRSDLSIHVGASSREIT